MKGEEISFKFKGKNLVFNVKKCSFIQKGVGLTFKSKNNAEALLFEFDKNSNDLLTSWFVFFPFAVFWLDDKNKVVDFKIVKPFIFSIKSKKPFSKVVEVPLNDKYMKYKHFSSVIRKI